jgi:hypothetical protein
VSGPRIQFYYREGCHLCEEMAATLYRGWSQVLDDVSWIDIDRDPTLVERYGQRVPVLMVDGKVICEFQADPERLSAVFGAPSNPV